MVQQSQSSMKLDSLTIAGCSVLLNKVLIIEETSNLTHTSCGKRCVPRLFLRRLASKRGNSLVPLDDSIQENICKIHVIYPSVCQFYCANHLESNPHYTVHEGEELSCLIRATIAKGILVRYYTGDKDHLDGDCVRVLNNLHRGEFNRKLQKIPWAVVFHAMKTLKSLDDRRGSFTSHVGFSATLGQGWHKPYPDLDQFAGEFGLCKPGITTSMPGALLAAMGPSLCFTGELAEYCWGKGSVNPDQRRQTEFSDVLSKYLWCSTDVFFEAGTFALLCGERQNLAVHTDLLNDCVAGYEKTGVLSMFLVDSKGITNRVTVIGYNRKCCNEFMIRMSEAKIKQQKSKHICNVMHTLLLRKQRNLRVIEASACLWLSNSASPDIKKSCHHLYTELEFTAASAVVNCVTLRGLHATQEKRPQIVSLKNAVRRFYHSVPEAVANIGLICKALTFVIHAHAKNHKLDGAAFLDSIRDKEQFESLFATYGTTMTLLPPAAGATTWVDVYGEYTYNKLFSTLKPWTFDDRLNKFVYQIEPGMVVDDLVKQLRKNKVFILGGRLFQIFAVVLFKEIGVVAEDENFSMYLPHKFTKTSGSVKLLQRHAGMADPYVCREYIKHYANTIGISAVTYENVLCKFHVGYYGKHNEN